MKTIKIKFVSFYGTINIQDNIIINLLKKKYNVVISDDPDFVFVSIFSQYFIEGILNEYLDYPQVRIMFQGENYVPDFNLVDYSISPYPIDFYDRNYYIPCGIEAFTKTDFKRFLSLPSGPRKFTKDDLDKKEYFANFIVSHESENGIRGKFFKKLCEYKRVESPGTLYNNMPDNCNVEWKEDSKPDFQRKTKFTICFESTNHYGFITEKIVDAFYSGTIPIYYGSKNIDSIFNSKAFINCNDFPDFDAVVERVKEIDNNDDLYIQMMQEPIFVVDNYPQNLMDGLESFLFNIFDQDPDDAFRRSRVYTPKRYEKFMSEASALWKKKHWFKIKKNRLHNKAINKIKTKYGSEKLIELRNKIKK